MSAILKVEKVSKRFGGLLALHDVDMVVEEGSIASLIGPNGAGKTTLFNVISGFYKPDEGRVILRNREITGLGPDRVASLGIARTYQNIRLFNAMSVLENILVGQHTLLRSGIFSSIVRTPQQRREEEQARQRAIELLRFVGLQGQGDATSRSLPYGAQRRVEIARALALQPKLLLLDEPAAGMNPGETEALIALIRRVRDTMGITVLLIEHDMNVVMGISDYVTVLDYGTKLAEGTPSQVRSDKRVIEAYLGRGVSTAA
jgi:branched-chain amino acid transport system ATP-binding protein